MFPIYKTEKEIKELEKNGYEVIIYGAVRKSKKSGEMLYNVSLYKNDSIIMN